MPMSIIISLSVEEMCEDTKVVIRSRKSKDKMKWTKEQ
jgi:hypothetical protein